MGLHDIPVQCTHCRHQCMESDWHDKPVKASGSISMTEKVCPKCKCKSYFDMRPQVAWCWASGLIEIGDAMPEDNADGSGALLIAKGPKSSLSAVLSGVARISYKGALVVPGVLEADGRDAEVDALIAWHAWCAKGNGCKHRKGVEFVMENTDEKL
jgi:uncharacterized paraquat-inducible protein A